jgi:hypothetical protein
MDLLTRDLFLGVMTSAFALGIAPYCFPHLFPTLKKSEGLPATVVELIARYVWGTSSLLLGFAVWLSLIGYAWVMIGLLAITAIGGLVVVFRYISEAIARMREHEEMIAGSDKEL